MTQAQDLAEVLVRLVSGKIVTPGRIICNGGEVVDIGNDTISLSIGNEHSELEILPNKPTLA